MRTNLYKYSLTLVATTLLVACSKVPGDILPEKKMRDVMLDVYLAESLIETNRTVYPDTVRKAALFQSVFRKHNITEAVYDSSLVWYSKNLDIYMQVLDMALADINTRIRDMGDVQASAAPNTNQDSINIWPRRDFSVLYPAALFNGVIFDIRPDRAYSSGSSFVLGMRVWGLTEQMRYFPEIRMAIDQNDTVLYVNKKVTKDGYLETILKGLPTKQIKRVYGYIRMDNTDKNYYKVYVDSLSLMKYNYGSPAMPASAPTDSIH
ncbi:MAG: DUF4296 domain-containing protein [Tannerellaceae bacterium]|jgi:hypothetical protein|nr:DUF4296 domain-containing protein [Tannerellaceae bacterium]